MGCRRARPEKYKQRITDNLLLNKCSHLEEEVDCHPLVISVVNVGVTKVAACVKSFLALSASLEIRVFTSNKIRI